MFYDLRVALLIFVMKRVGLNICTEPYKVNCVTVVLIALVRCGVKTPVAYHV